MTNEPSPRPWRVSETLGHAYIVQDARGSVVAHTETCALSVRPRHRADAALIVDAVNERDRLRDLVRQMAETLEHVSKEHRFDFYDLVREARAAIGEDKK